MIRTAFFSLCLLCLLAVSSYAAPPHTFGLYAGANGVWYDGVTQVLPSSFELGLNGKVSLSPHISGVGSGYYGFNGEYVRGSAGARITATNVDDPNFSIGLGMQYQVASKTEDRPLEWVPDASIGWVPSPVNLPKVTLVGQGGYGLVSHRLQALLGVRYTISN